MLAPRKPSSTTSSGTHSRNAFQRGHSHRSVSTRKKMRVVMAIVIVTAMPYAAASAVEVWKPMTRPTQATISAQFTSGT
jgi:hypothetical protein